MASPQLRNPCVVDEGPYGCCYIVCEGRSYRHVCKPRQYMWNNAWVGDVTACVRPANAYHIPGSRGTLMVHSGCSPRALLWPLAFTCVSTYCPCVCVMGGAITKPYYPPQYDWKRTWVDDVTACVRPAYGNDIPVSLGAILVL